MSNFLDGLDPKQSTDTLTASEWNFLINSLKNMRFTDLSDVSVDIAQEGEVPVLVGGGWVPAPMTGGGGTPTEVNWNTLVGKPFSTINLNDFIVIGNELNIVASLKTPDWNNVQNKPIDVVDNKLVYGSCDIYHSCNSNLEYVDWKAGTLRLSDGVNESLIQVKTQSSLYRTILEYDQSLNKINIGRSSSVLGIGLYYENIEIAKIEQNLFYISKRLTVKDNADFYGDVRLNTLDGIGRAMTVFGQELAIGSSEIIKGVSLFYGTGKKIYTDASGVTVNGSMKADNIYASEVYLIKHGTLGYGGILRSSGDSGLLKIGFSGITKGVEVYHGFTKVSETQSDGMKIIDNLYCGGSIKAERYYTAESTLSNLNSMPNFDRGIQAHRYSSDAINKPITVNNANGLINIMSHPGVYGKQIAFGDDDDLYMRRVSAGLYKTWHKVYSTNNANKSNVNWNMFTAYIDNKAIIRGSSENERLQLWGDNPYLAFYNENTDQRKAYIQAYGNDLLINSDSGKIKLRPINSEKGTIDDWGLSFYNNSIFQLRDKIGTSWNNYSTTGKSTMGAYDTKLVNSSDASWIWSVRDHGNSFKAGFQILNNGQRSQLHLSNRCKIIAWDSVFEFYIDGQKVAELNSSGTFRAASDIQAQVNF